MQAAVNISTPTLQKLQCIIKTKNLDVLCCAINKYIISQTHPYPHPHGTGVQWRFPADTEVE